MKQLGTNISQAEAVSLTPTQAAQLEALQNQRRVTAYPYYSTVSLIAFQGGNPGGPYLYTLVHGAECRAFSYGVGQPMGSAICSSAGPLGGAGPPVATPADTNLVNRSETISGENVEIHGLALQLKHYGIANSKNDGDARPCSPALLAGITSNVSIDLSLNGDQNRFHLGTLGQLPGAGGLAGSLSDATGIAQLNGLINSYQFAANGWPTRSNFFRMPEGLVWRNKGMADSQLNVIFRVERDINIWSGGDTVNNVGGPVVLQGTDRDADYANGIQGYRFPTMVEVVILVQLLGRVVGDRTRSA